MITGASSGIGKELAIKFAENGHNLILLARRPNVLEKLSKELGGKFNVIVRYFQCDLTSRSELEKNTDTIINKYNVEVLINNAGVGDFRLFADSDLNKNDFLIDLNIKAVLYLTHKLLPNIISKGGKILNVASFAAYIPGPFIAAYAASKNFILNFSLSLSTELKEKNIQVSVLSPGDIPTDFQKNSGLGGFDPKNALSAEELAEFTYEEFMNKGSIEIIPPQAQETINLLNKSRNKGVAGKNLLFLRKRLATTLTKTKNN